MAFDLSTWKQSAADKLRGIGGWFDRRAALVAFHSSLTDEREIARLVADDGD